MVQMLKRLNHFLRVHREQVFRISFAVVFILRGIMQLFPWLVIHGFTGDFVVHGHDWELAHCAVGLGILLIRWKPTFLRVGAVWLIATALAFMIFYFLYIFRDSWVYVTTAYLIPSFLIGCAWGLGTGIILAVLYERLMDYLLKKVYLITAEARKREKRRKKRRKKKK